MNDAGVVLGDRGVQGLALGAVAVEDAAQALDSLRGQGYGGHAGGDSLLGDQAPGEQHERVGLHGGGEVVGSVGPAYSPRKTVTGPRRPASRRRAACSSREAESALGDARAQALHQLAHAPAEAAEVGAPVVAAPHLKPVDDEAVARERARQRGGEQREVGEGAGVHDVVAAAVAQQVPEHAGAEHERRQDAPARAGVQRHARAGGDDANARVEVEPLAAIPLAQRQIGHLVPLGHQSLGQVAIPALGAADRVREQAVVDQADAHGGRDCQEEAFADPTVPSRESRARLLRAVR